MMNFFTFADQSSVDFGIYISGDGTFNAPERDVTTYSIPGRNGDLIVDNGRFLNISLAYQAFIPFGFPLKAERIRLWLKSKTGYQRLEDTYHPEFFRMAYMANTIDFKPKVLNRSAEFTLNFICQPQRWLKTGELPININQSGARIFNAYMPSLPIFKVYGSGSGALVVNQTTVVIKDISEYMMIDCDIQNAYKGTVNQNQNISAPVFPELQSGENTIAWSGNITGVEIVPRWWTI